ncbi:uncharacterized protein N7482_001441 [Penicillium canariense]|uniref:Uncharacterized protein n=1 Tax=Penicillium canariense TaxID=189055 RepID=A0A9W9LTW8_9EURO|nr:uncharacterized protein N7482_001441 [Penicillium canariense]KAJ5175564.1 hypothetical protein N7482_001441 [Penicillium canariense]
MLIESAAAEFNLAESYFGGIDFSKEPEGIKDNLETLMREGREKFIAEIKKSSILGYAFKANHTGKSFHLTSVGRDC